VTRASVGQAHVALGRPGAFGLVGDAGRTGADPERSERPRRGVASTGRRRAVRE